MRVSRRFLKRIGYLFFSGLRGGGLLLGGSAVRERLAVFLVLLAALFFQGCGSGHFRFPTLVFPKKLMATDFPDSGAVVLNDVRSIDFRLSETRGRTRLIVVEKHHRRLKILRDSGLQEAMVALPTDGFSTVTNVAARSAGPGGEVERMKRGAVRHTVRAGGHQGASQLGATRFTIPGAQVGGILEYYYERVYTEPDMVPVWVLGDRLPVVRSELSLSADPAVRIQYRFGRGGRLVDASPLSRAGSDGRERLVFVERDLEAVRPEVGMPHRAWLSPWVAIVASSAQIGGRKYRMETWGHVAERVSFLVGQVPVGLIPTSGTSEDIFRAIRDGVNSVLEPGVGVLRPVSKKDFEKNLPVSTRDAAAILASSLREAGEDAHVALISGNSGPPLLDGFPGLYPFVRAVVAVDVHKRLAKEGSCDGAPAQRSVLCSTAAHGYTFVDPSCKTCRFGELPTELSGGRALILSSVTPEWVDVPVDPPERNFSVLETNFRAGLDGRLTGTARLAVGGEPSRSVKEVLRHEKGSKTSNGKLKQELQLIVGAWNSRAFFDVEFGERGDADILRIESRLESKLKQLAYDRFEVRAQNLTGLAFPWKWRQLRHSPRVLEAPLWRQASSALRVPPGFMIEQGTPVEIKNRFGEFSASWKVEGDTLRYWRSLILRRQVVLPHDWRDFTHFLEAIRESESRPIKIVRVVD